MYVGSYSFPNYFQSKQVEIWYPGSLCWGKFSRGICLKSMVGGHGAEKGEGQLRGVTPIWKAGGPFIGLGGGRGRR